MTQNR